MFDELTQKEKNAVKEMAKVLIDYSSESQMQKILDNLELLETLSYQFGERVEPFDDEELEYHEYYTFEDTIELVKKFLGTIDPEYLVKFDELLNSQSALLAAMTGELDNPTEFLYTEPIFL